MHTLRIYIDINNNFIDYNSFSMISFSRNQEVIIFLIAQLLSIEKNTVVQDCSLLCVLLDITFSNICIYIYKYKYLHIHIYIYI